MLKYELPGLSDGEKKMPLAKYYEDYPLYCVPPLQQQLLDNGPIDSKDALAVENWLDLLTEPGVYRDTNFGYCMMPDGSGLYMEYTVIPEIPGPMKRWYMNFINHKSKSQPEGTGNIRYKLWNPIDHWDRDFVDPDHPEKGTYTIGALDQGRTKPWEHGKEFVHRIDLQECGFPKEEQNRLEAMGCRISAGWEDFDEPGHHMWLHIDRPCPFGGIEMIGVEWIGWYVKDGKLIRDPETYCSEQYLKDVLIHNIVEHLHLPQFLPAMYEEYKDQSIDAD